MKKKCTFLALAAMLCMGNLFAIEYPYMYTDYKTVNVNSTDEWITIDGIEEDVWAGVAEQSITKVLRNPNEDPMPNTWGYAASYKALYDLRYMYLFIKVTDDTYIPWEQGKGDTSVDNIELFFYPNAGERDEVTGGTPIDARGRGLSQVRISVGNTVNRATGGGYAMGFKTGTTEEPTLPEFEYVTVKTATGYNVEVVIPWDILLPGVNEMTEEEYEAIFTPGNKILFDLDAANCITSESNRVIILGWSGEDFNAWKSNAMLGELVFSGAPSGIKSITTSNVKYAFNNGILSLNNVEGTPQVDVYDLFGRSVKSAVYSGADIDLTSIASGVYIVNVAGAGSFKIVK